MKRYGSDVMVDAIKACGFRYLPLNPGSSYRGLHDSLVNYGGNDPEIITCNHEKLAVGIAHGYAKAAREPAACVLHDIVGLLQGTMGIYYAWIDRAPVVVFGGAGQVAKTANNILLWACIRADVEALRLGRALGVEPGALREAMALGSGSNRPLDEWGKHRLRWPEKDLEVALALAQEVGVDAPLVAQLRALMAELSVDDLAELL